MPDHLYFLRFSQKGQYEKGQYEAVKIFLTDRPTDRPTDKPNYRSSLPELKKAALKPLPWPTGGNKISQQIKE